MAMLVYFEDLVEGAVFSGREVVANKDEMLEYARQYDPWPFHVDAEAAKQTPFGGLVASAGYTFSLWCRSFHTVYRTPEAGWAFLGGYDLHVKLLEPVRPGDRLRLRVSIEGKRSSSRPGRGHVDCLHVLTRQDGVPVFSVRVSLLVATRPSA
ncbi:MAG: MaoC/PaaZ C-terminal domain-containing protein [Nitrospiraceae bacterium]